MIIRHLLMMMCFIIPLHVCGQEYLKIVNGSVSFVSDAPLELIKAESKELAGIINPADGKFAFKAKIISFNGFNSPLQQEHFNENYMESDRFPITTFSGRIIEDVDFSVDGIHEVRAKGKLTAHGVEQERIIPARIQIKDGAVAISSRFIVPLADHNISIPQIVEQKIAREINVTVNATLKFDEPK